MYFGCFRPCISWSSPVGSLMLLRWHNGQTATLVVSAADVRGSGGTGAGHRTGF